MVVFDTRRAKRTCTEELLGTIFFLHSNNTNLVRQNGTVGKNQKKTSVHKHMDLVGFIPKI